MFRSDNSNLSNSITLSYGANATSVSSDLIVPEGCVIKQTSDFVPSDNEHNLISKQVHVIVNFAISVIALPLCFLVSFSTNVVNLVAFYQQGLKERVNMCLFSLSLIDMLFVAVAYGINSSVVYMFAIGKEDSMDPSKIFFFNYYLIGFLSLAVCSQLISTLVALDRCLCITRPLRFKNLMSTKKAAVLLWFMLLLLLIIGIATESFRLKVICVFNLRDNSTTFQYFPRQFYRRNKPFVDVFGGIIFGTISPALCAVCVTICTVIIVLQMKKQLQWRETVSSASGSLTSRDLAVTRMIVGTSVLFIICIVPSIIVRVSLNLVPGLHPGGRYENMFHVVARFYYLASTINSTVNFFVYYAYGSKFRQTVKRLFLSCVCCYAKRGTECKSSGK